MIRRYNIYNFICGEPNINYKIVWRHGYCDQEVIRWIWKLGSENKLAKRIKNKSHGVWSRKKYILEDQKACIRGSEEFEHLGLRIDKENRQYNNIENIINKGRSITTFLTVHCETDK